MFPEGREFDLFRGLSFFGGFEHVPRDVPLSLLNLRDWATREGLAREPGQLLNPERIAVVAGVCSPEDKLLVAVEIVGGAGTLFYQERAYLPVRSMIRRGDVISLTYWRISVGSVKFRFWLPECAEEFCSESNALRVIPRFAEMLDKLADKYGQESLPDGSRTIAVQGRVRASFRKDGRSFDVELEHRPAA